MLKVVQCWDDGVINDERLANLLRKYNAKATFNLNPGAMLKDERIPSRWLDAYSNDWSYLGYSAGKLSQKDILEVLDGFELASHCMLHETVGRVDDETFIKSAIDARKFLEDLVQKECKGFAWPCGVFSDTTIKLMHEAGFAYGRTTNTTNDVTKCADPMMLAASCHFSDRAFFNKYEEAKAKGGVFYFWGHSYEMLEYDKLWEQFEEKLKRINDDPDSEWCNVIDIVPMLKA